MGKIRTSASFYRRGIPSTFHSFGHFTQGNYPIVQPQYSVLRSLNNNKSKIVSKFSKYMGINLYNNIYY